MFLYWLCYRLDGRVSVVILPAYSLIAARLRASLDKLDEGEFGEGHELDEKMALRVPKKVIGKRLTRQEAEKLLERIASK